jgi:hypothetical protein
MKYKEYLSVAIDFIIHQKILFTIIALTIAMLITIIGMPVISNKAIYKNPGNTTSNQSPDQKINSPSSKSSVADTSSPSNSSSIQPSANSEPNLFTKFIYIILPFMRPNQDQAQNQSQNSSASNANNNSTQPALSQSQQQPTISTISSISSGGSGGDSTGGNNNQGSGSSGGSGGTSGGYTGPMSYTPTPTPTPINIVYVPSPTPVTDIDLVFEDEGGDFWTYTPPDDPPIDSQWSVYTNYQDNYSIEIPSDWQIIKSDYNGHESVILYNPDSANTVDKPTIAFVGWQANYLSSSAKYTGQIILNDIPGTIYTNGFLGPSSIAAVFKLPNGYFALGSSITDPVFIYVFDHMIRSVQFDVN